MCTLGSFLLPAQVGHKCILSSCLTPGNSSCLWPAQVGGTPAILKYLHERNYIDGSCMTVTGKTMAENLAACPGLKEGQQVGPALPMSNLLLGPPSRGALRLIAVVRVVCFERTGLPVVEMIWAQLCMPRGAWRCRAAELLG